MFNGIWWGEFLFLIYIRFHSSYMLKLYPDFLENESYYEEDWSPWDPSVLSSIHGWLSHAISMEEWLALLLAILRYPFSCKHNN